MGLRYAGSRPAPGENGAAPGAAAESPSRRSRTREEALLTPTDEFVWEAELEPLRFTFVGQLSQRILGHTPARWLANADFWLEVIHPDDRQRVLRLRALAGEERGGHTFDYRAITAVGRVVWLRDIIWVVGGRRGQPPRMRGATRDVTQLKEAELRAAFLEPIVDELSNAAFVFDGSSLRVQSANRRALELSGYTLEELRRLSIHDLCPELNGRFDELVEPLRSGAQESATLQTVQRRKDRSTQAIRARLRLIRVDGAQAFVAVQEEAPASGNNGTDHGSAPASEDLAWRSAPSAPEQSFMARLGGAVRLVTDPIALSAELTKVVAETLGYDFALIAVRTSDGLEPLGSWPDDIGRAAHGSECDLYARLDHINGLAQMPRGWVRCQLLPRGPDVFALVPLSDSTSVRFGLLAVGRDSATGISEEDQGRLRWAATELAGVLAVARTHEALLSVATQDPLTRLLTRDAFFAEMKSELARAHRTRETIAYLAWDLDKLKSVNETYGRHAGDQALRAFADILRRQSRSYDVLGRIGGDGFAMLVTRTTHETAHKVATRVFEDAARTRFDGKHWMPTAHHGLALYPDDGSELEQLVRIAEWRLYGNQHAPHWLARVVNNVRERMGLTETGK